ncbi:hypothetical protein [Kordiimonas laminariae]|uniref:hypothetical protein n=1 Tax=Kordiimonas laminariae TaxID=2917717 RepID=UPI001FF18199|nr:hypothetical protein [Kordiimonas laminariae]MCK0069036.1 hypothetical protein [Kordiimonas laminariae]
MKLLNATFVTIAVLSLGACAVSIEGGNGRYDDHHNNYLTVTLPSGDRDEFSCPTEMQIFVEDNRAQGGGLTYGCRSVDAEEG